MMRRIGFMQGRLSPLVDGRIQAFPRDHWREEFPLAERLGLRLMEWTLDQEGLHDNPFMTPSGRREIRALCERHGLRIPSLTGDCFMQAPWWKAPPSEREARERDFTAVLRACVELGVGIVVVPLVDEGRVEDARQEERVIELIFRHRDLLVDNGVRIAFESDYPARELARFMGRLPEDCCGVNYDIGNSAAAGYDHEEEFAAYGDRIVNVHVKDRPLGGSTVPLGEGDAPLARVVAALERLGYRGNYILQTARAENGDHAGVLADYAEMTRQWLEAAHGPEA